MRSLRKTVAFTLPVLGMVLVFVAILVPAINLNLQLQLGVVLAGLLVIEAGVWRLTAKILPNERQFLALRTEVDDFIGRVRVLNARAVKLRQADTEETRADFRETLDSLHASVDRMAEVAGKRN